MSKIEYYRGVSKNESDISVPSAYRFVQDGFEYEKRIYKHVIENRKNYAFLHGKRDSIFQQISFLSLLQHYGFPTRLLDITRKKEIAMYFACCSDFNRTGYIGKISLEDNKNVHLIKNDPKKLKLIKEKIKLINGEYSVGDNIRTLKSNPREKLKNSIEKNISIDYKLAFGVDIANVRCLNQEGCFIMFGNKVVDNKITDNLNIDENLFEIVETIKAEEKIKRLFRLAKKEISYKYVFPDSEQTIKIRNIMEKNEATRDDVLYVNGQFENCNKDFQNDILTYLNSSKELWDFILVDYINYVSEVNEMSISLETLMNDNNKKL